MALVTVTVLLANKQWNIVSLEKILPFGQTGVFLVQDNEQYRYLTSISWLPK